LSSTSDTVVKTVFVRVIATIGVGKEESIEVSTLEKLGQVYPVVQLPFGCRFVFGVLKR